MALVPKENGWITANDGIQLHYEIWGDGSHPIICIPGVLGTIRQDFGPQLEYFARQGSGFKIVSFDMRWCGTRPQEIFFKRDMDFYTTDAQDANAVMQALHFTEYSVFGWSAGAISSFILAASFPESVRSLVAWGGLGYLTKEYMDVAENIRDISNWNPKLRDPLLKTYGSASLVQKLWSECMDANIDIVDKRDGYVCEEELSKIKCPTLIVHGGKDPMVPFFHTEFIKDRIKGCKLVVIENGSHDLHLRSRSHKEFNEVVGNFLNHPKSKL